MGPGATPSSSSSELDEEEQEEEDEEDSSLMPYSSFFFLFVKETYAQAISTVKAYAKAISTAYAELGERHHTSAYVSCCRPMKS